MTLDVRIAHRVEEIGQEAWDRLSGDRPFASYHWYRYGEVVLADNVSVYIILSQQGDPVARATFWLRNREALPISSRPVRSLVDLLLRCWPLLVCRSPLADMPGLILPQDPSLRNSALGTIAQVAQEQARRYRASFLAYVYLEKNDRPNLTSMEFPTPRTRLLITWPDFESYLKHLSRSARRDYRRHCKHAADLGIAVKHAPIVQPLDKVTIDKALMLIQNVYRQHNSPLHPWARAMLENAHLVDAIWLEAWAEERMVGCDLLLGEKNDTWMMTLLGLDYRVQYVYFQLMYLPIKCAIEANGRVLWGGTGTYEMKERLGFQVLPRHYVSFSAATPLLQRLAKVTARLAN